MIVNKFKKLYLRIKSSAFFQHFSILVSGAVLAKVITLLIYPIITRIYSPEEFGTFSLFTSIIIVLAPISMLRYNIAIVTADNDNDSKNLFIFSISVSLLFSMLVLLFFILGENFFKNILDAHKLNLWWYLIPLCIFVTSFNDAITRYLNRSKNYILISKINVIRSFSYSIMAITIGYVGLTYSGLFIAHILAIFISIIFAVTSMNSLKVNFLKIYKNFSNLFKKYIDFPKYDLLATFLNNLTTMMPIFFLNKFFSYEIVGQYALAVKTVFFPLTFISSSLSTIHLRKSKELIDKQGNLKWYMIKLFLILFFIVLVPSLILFFHAPEIFSYIFGSDWRLSGRFVQILIPALSFIFIVSTLSPIFYSTGKMNLFSNWSKIYFITLLVFFYFQSENSDIESLLFYFSCINIVMYSFYLFLIFYSIKDQINK